MIFDVDRIPVPDHLIGDWVDEPDAAVEHVLGLLPEPFRPATCWWSISSSAAIPGPQGRDVATELKLKLAFWLDRTLTGAEVKRWMAAEQAPVDPAVFGAVQLIYVARPGFGPGLHDPVARRSGIWQGEADAVEVPALLPEPEPHSYGTRAAEFAPAEELDELCAQLRARLEGELHVREHLLQAARAYMRQHGPNVDQRPLVAALEGVALEYRTQGEVAGYGVDRLVEHVARQELRTPLNAIIGFTRLVMRRAKDALPDKQYDNLGKILASAEHLLSLINSVLDLSKIEAGRIEVRLTAFALEPVIDQCLRTVEPMVKGGLRLEKQIEPDLPTLCTDQEKLRQILINLLANAVKFTEAGSVTVRAVHERGVIALAVADTGIGIPENAKELVFEEFRQVDSSSTRQHGGTGLGLPISRHLARLLGGDITLESRAGGGSTFTLTIPARHALEEAAEKGAPEALPASAEGDRRQVVEAARREPLVLAIDDDPNMLYLLRENLGEAGYRVMGAAGGEEGVRKARELRPSAIVLDVVMPHKDGWQVLHELKADPATRDIPVIMLSIVDQKDLGYRLGAFDYLLKPFEREALVATLQRIAAPPCRMLVVDDDPLVVDLVRQMLEGEECEIESAMDGEEALAALARRRPDVVLLDLLMPRLDGFGVIDQLEQNPALRGLPVIVLTAKTLDPEERALLQRRVMTVIEKRGLDRAALLTEVRRALPAYCRGGAGASGDEEDPDRRGRRAESRSARAAS